MSQTRHVLIWLSVKTRWIHWTWVQLCASVLTLIVFLLSFLSFSFNKNMNSSVAFWVILLIGLFAFILSSCVRFNYWKVESIVWYFFFLKHLEFPFRYWWELWNIWGFKTWGSGSPSWFWKLSLSPKILSLQVLFFV